MGKQGINGISKLVSLLLAAIAVSLIRRGLAGAIGRGVEAGVPPAAKDLAAKARRPLCWLVGIT